MRSTAAAGLATRSTVALRLWRPPFAIRPFTINPSATRLFIIGPCITGPLLSIRFATIPSSAIPSSAIPSYRNKFFKRIPFARTLCKETSLNEPNCKASRLRQLRRIYLLINHCLSINRRLSTIALHRRAHPRERPPILRSGPSPRSD